MNTTTGSSSYSEKHVNTPCFRPIFIEYNQTETVIVHLKAKFGREY